MTRGSLHKLLTHMVKHCATDQQGDRQPKANMRIYTYKQTHSHTAAALLMSSFAKKSEQLVLGCK